MQFVKEVREHAVENYEKDGWDFLVECWEDKDIAECITGARTLSEAIAKCKRVVKYINERRQEVQNEVW